MQTKRPSAITGYSPHRYSLSARGFATAALCPEPPSNNTLDGSWDRLQSERAQWAYAHGLDPLDGAYLYELSRRPLTVGQLGEALAILSQTSQMVEQAVVKLGSLGLVEQTQQDDEGEQSPPARQAVEAELSAALDDLHLVLTSFEDESHPKHRTAGVTLRRAIGRVVAARRLSSAQSFPSADEG